MTSLVKLDVHYCYYVVIMLRVTNAVGWGLLRGGVGGWEECYGTWEVIIKARGAEYQISSVQMELQSL